MPSPLNCAIEFEFWFIYLCRNTYSLTRWNRSGRVLHSFAKGATINYTDGAKYSRWMMMVQYWADYWIERRFLMARITHLVHKESATQSIMVLCNHFRALLLLCGRTTAKSPPSTDGAFESKRKFLSLRLKILDNTHKDGKSSPKADFMAVNKALGSCCWW